MPELRYEAPREYSREEATDIFKVGDVDAISSLMIGLAYYDPDWRWVLDHCLRLSTDGNPQLRYIAALCVSHLARIHSESDLPKVRPMLLRLKSDPDQRVQAMAEDAIEDIEMFLGVNFADPKMFN